jgi:hypothetical protein
MKDLRSALYAIADTLAERLDSAQSMGTVSGAEHADSAAFRAACEEFVRGVAAGNIALRLPHGLSDAQRQTLAQALDRVRNVLQIARESSTVSTQRTETIIHAMEAIASASYQQRTLIDRSIDELRPLATRLDELAQQCTELTANSDRVALLALNTGIEGLRVGGEVARALSTLGEEIRRIAQRDAVLARSVTDALKAHRGSIDRSAEQCTHARDTLQIMVDHVSNAAAAAEAARVVDETLMDAVGGFQVHDNESQAALDQLAVLTKLLTVELPKARAIAQRNVTSSPAIDAAISQLSALLTVETK